MTAVKTIAIGSDHAGFVLKQSLLGWLEGQGHQVLDVGTHSEESVDYPDFGSAVARAIRDGQATRGVLVCGTGIGIAIAANRYAAVRAAVCQDVTTARLARQHNDANVLSLGARIIGTEVAIDCVDAFMSTDYDGGRHDRRVSKLGTVDD